MSESTVNWALTWTLLNMLIPITIVVAIVWYTRQKLAFQKGLLERIDRLINVLEKSNG
jgi:hypothetical protein